ncbi:MAG: hypothetical protein Q9M14_00420 [Mariprofundaceae bacterium]|nr:hypothetical protein [Mariprofundaceae bacterium]
MINALLLFACLIGIIFNLGFSGVLLQPDWSLALLLAALLAHRGNWLWVALATGIHDLILYWSIFISLPWILLTPIIITWSDAQIGPSLLQRFFSMLLVTTSLFFAGWSFVSCLLTLLLCLVFWHLITRLYVQPA